MKKVFKFCASTILILSFLIINSTEVFADTVFRQFDFSVDGAQVGNKISGAFVNVKVALENTPDFFADRSNEFIFEDAAWYECKDANCDNLEQVYVFDDESDEESNAVFEVDKKYVFKMRFYTLLSSKIDPKNASDLTLNSTPFADGVGDYYFNEDDQSISISLFFDFDDGLILGLPLWAWIIIGVCIVIIGGGTIIIIKHKKKYENCIS